jgi:hypothetical protein
VGACPVKYICVDKATYGLIHKGDSKHRLFVHLSVFNTVNSMHPVADIRRMWHKDVVWTYSLNTVVYLYKPKYDDYALELKRVYYV